MGVSCFLSIVPLEFSQDLSCLQDNEAVLELLVQRGEWHRALAVLRQPNLPQELMYKFAPSLMASIPAETVRPAVQIEAKAVSLQQSANVRSASWPAVSLEQCARQCVIEAGAFGHACSAPSKWRVRLNLLELSRL